MDERLLRFNARRTIYHPARRPQAVYCVARKRRQRQSRQLIANVMMLLLEPNNNDPDPNPNHIFMVLPTLVLLLPLPQLVQLRVEGRVTVLVPGPVPVGGHFLFRIFHAGPESIKNPTFRAKEVLPNLIKASTSASLLENCSDPSHSPFAGFELIKSHTVGVPTSCLIYSNPPYYLFSWPGKKSTTRFEGVADWGEGAAARSHAATLPC